MGGANILWAWLSGASVTRGLAMLTRQRSKSIDSSDSSQGSSLIRQSSSASTFIDSQDSAPPYRHTPTSRHTHLPTPKSTQWVVIAPSKNRWVGVVYITPLGAAFAGDTLNNAHPNFISYPDPHTGI